jgi:RecA/RadA recombinase
MEIGRQIVANILAEKKTALQRFLSAGFDLAWMTSTKDLSRAAIFSESDRAAYQFILRQWEEKRAVPSLDYFRHSYPEECYRLPEEPGATTTELVEMATSNRLRVQVETVLSESLDRAEEGNPVAADAVLREYAERAKPAGAVPLPFRVVPLSALNDLPDPEPLIHGDVIDRGTVTMLAGPSGHGKSFLALDWACSVATGSEWLGHDAVQGRVLYVAAEGGTGMKSRVRSWRKAHGVIDDKYFTMVIDPVQFGDAEALAGLISIAADFDFVIIDTVARCTAGLEENSARDMGLFVSALYKIRDAREECGTTVLIVHHTGYDRSRARGSSALQAGVDNVYQVNALGDDPRTLFTLTTTKRKDGPVPADRALKLEVVGSSCVVEEAEPLFNDGPSLMMLLRPDIGQKAQELAGQMGISPQAVKVKLKRLIDAGTVKCTERKGTQGNLYQLTEGN